MEINFSNKTSKVKQLADALSLAISRGEFNPGDSLPSINEISAKYKISRDTVFKAFKDLKQRNLVDSSPAKGYFVKGKIMNILLLLDEYSPFKEALYNNFIEKLPRDYKVDLLFHQYNKRLFSTIIRESVGWYNKYVVMNFHNEQFSPDLKKIEPGKLLLLDFGKFEKDAYSYVCQDFDTALYNCLGQVLENIKKYRKFVMYFPSSCIHPASSKEYFKKFCTKNKINGEIVVDTITADQIRPGTAYLIIRNRELVDIVKQCKKNNLQIGESVGIIAYNDMPVYEIIENGITTISTDFEMMGRRAADFVLKDERIQEYVPTRVTLRGSL